MARAVAVGAALVALLTGCALDRTGLGRRDAGAPVSDAGSADGGADADARDAAMDARLAVDAATDSGVDAPPGDAGRDAALDARVPSAGTALSFDGDDFVRTLRTVADDFTLEAWIRTTTSRSGAQFYEGRGLVYADEPGVDDDFGSSVLNDRFAFGVGNPDQTIQSTTLVTTGEWVHVAATRHRSTGSIAVYVNGIREATSTATNRGPLDRRGNVELGGNVIDSRYFVGTMDEVRVWNVVRTAAEIRAAMSLSLSGTEPGLVGYWRFDDGVGATATDATPSSNDGSLGAGSSAQRPSWVASTAPIVR